MPFAKNCDYVAVFYCDTPLLTPKIIDECIDYATLKQIKICKLTRGYIFESNFLLNYSPTQQMEAFNFYENNFLAVNTLADLEKAQKILQERIMLALQYSGVTIENSNSCTIESTVQIKPTTKIYPNNHIYGSTCIGAGVTLFENNVIRNCQISNNCKLSSSILTNCIVHKNTIIQPFSVYNSCEIKMVNKQIKTNAISLKEIKIS